MTDDNIVDVEKICSDSDLVRWKKELDNEKQLDNEKRQQSTDDVN